MPARRLLPVVLLLPALAACGDDEAEALSHDEYVEQGDAICARLTEETDALDQPTDLPSAVTFLDESLPLARAAREDFAELAAPDDAEEVREALLSSIDVSIDAAGRARDAAANDDQAGVEAALAEATEAGAASDPVAQEYGFVECGTDDE